ncbi:transketolase C-terminal domain-containing protein [Hippea jasoniae]|uniref:transketolase C-terminal domain-containing protein n=1 Tax=Hippea jasoniae TaxID=944479 RepID=UPI00054D36B9|nr:transketolase C-terminal domain-containing protein [Hippea jasoniae]
MSKRVVLGGNDAVAYAVKQSYVDVVSAYPITPQTSIIEKIASFIAKGEMDATFIRVESEHSAMAAAMGASVAGSRVFTATSSQGLLLMHEVLHWAAGDGLPIVMANANRAVAPPWSIWAEQTDSLSQRDTGWIQFYCSNAQEVYDLVFIGFRLAEAVSNPVMVCMDGFLLTHTKEPVDVFEEEIKPFIQKKDKWNILDVENPQAIGALAFPNDYMPIKIQQNKRILSALEKFDEISKEFEAIANRRHEKVYIYPDNTADVAVVTMGSLAETARIAVDNLNSYGIKSKLVKINMFRPFPKEELKKAIGDSKYVVVFDRNISMGKGGIVKDEVAGSLGLSNAIGVVCGLGGVDVTEKDIEKVIKKVVDGKITEDFILWGEI